ncbi:MAG: DnaJ domain-containing protein [Proteobacteria bacterium]|nr:DnaJ domain-containing protein [Pseudomonadota bacterium]
MEPQTDASPDVQGDLQRYPLPRLLYYLYKRSLLGRLEIDRAEGGTAKVFFREGVPIHADLPTTEDLLGRVLLENGWITGEQFERSLAEYAEGRQLYGQILLGMGAITEERLVNALQLQLRRKLNRVFSYQGAPFRLFSGDHDQGLRADAARVRVDPLWLIHNGVRNAFGAEQLAGELSKLADTTVQLRPDFAKWLPRYGFDKEEGALLTILERGALPVPRLARISNLGPLATDMLLYVLWVTEALVLGQEEIAPSASAGIANSAEPPLRGGSPAGTDPQRPTSVPDLTALAGQFAGTPPAGAVARGAAGQGEPPAAAARSGSGVYAVPRPGPGSAAARRANAPSTSPGTSAAAGSSPRDASSGAKQRAAARDLRELIETASAALGGKTHFEVLALEPTATAAQVRDAYFSLAKQFHPDRVLGLGLRDLAQKAEELFRRTNEAYTVLADAKARAAYEASLSQPAGAKDEARTALEAEFCFQRGTVAFRKKQFAKALEEFTEARRLSGSEGEHLAWIAWTTFCDPQVDKAAALPKIKQLLLESLELAPKNAQINYFLGETYLALGEERRAVGALNRALEIKPDHVDAQRRMRLIRMRGEKEGGGKGQGALGGLLDRWRKK